MRDLPCCLVGPSLHPQTQPMALAVLHQFRLKQDSQVGCVLQLHISVAAIPTTKYRLFDGMRVFSK
ncbi:hypothetical protein BDN72DRAFT_491856 [Pluteus cervinus]|uniref:Uncharacterized protein n=1 Tax=Pluteus cervinus TaxID=181527 RepID=A0ACD3AZ26_9AGAR|nr:hypothetical protein BDN72DRAFT_491856 [Pluteus cervinus]